MAVNTIAEQVPLRTRTGWNVHAYRLNGSAPCSAKPQAACARLALSEPMSVSPSKIMVRSNSSAKVANTR